jgi:4-hydroxybenzoate polyprenyltransferase
MNSAPAHTSQSTLFQLRLYFALSRTPHGVLDMATPAAAALLWYGSFPPLGIALLGLVTAFAGYTAVYALNDLVDYRVDQMRFSEGLFPDLQNDLDSIFVRHPMAYGLLPFKKALLWTMAWAFLALAGAYLLNPFCVAIFLIACALETVYCLLWKSSYLKTFISGSVKTSGAVAAVFAVDPTPSMPFLILLFLWLFSWEIGGQNIPNDWSDIEEDRLLKAASVPVCFGEACAGALILFFLTVVLALNLVLWSFASRLETFPFVGMAASFCAGIYLLLVPALRLYRTREQSDALALFNRASYYPVTMLVIVILNVIIWKR